MPRAPKPRGYLSQHGRGYAIAGPVTVKNKDGEVIRTEPPHRGPRRVPAHKVRLQQRHTIAELGEHLWAPSDKPKKTTMDNSGTTEDTTAT